MESFATNERVQWVAFGPYMIRWDPRREKSVRLIGSVFVLWRGTFDIFSLSAFGIGWKERGRDIQGWKDFLHLCYAHVCFMLWRELGTERKGLTIQSWRVIDVSVDWITDLATVGSEDTWSHFIGIDVFILAKSSRTIRFSNWKRMKGHIVN